ncbi:S8 family serine peptidase [Streptomyces sp.]|uniref:S8 family peptidase n=1 Tax=Streptomyces sp. TaxID=1931 RepID=UPI0025DD69DD|nr:S8 family serine peptidase [Streptomyces sp.]
MENGGDLYVYPDAVVPYIAEGILDRRLFDVSDLVADGYDDAHTDGLPLIVSYVRGAAGRQADVQPPGATRVRGLDGIGGAALTEDRSRSQSFWTAVTRSGTDTAGRAATAKPAFAAGIARIWLDGRVKADLADTAAQIGAPQVWAGGDTGQGVDVAVLDTGVDTGHPDLAGRIAATRSFVPDEDVQDHNGHGTHVASTIAGTGAASDGTEKGVAPGARLHIGKVLSNSGTGQDSDILAGMEWAAVDEHAKVINMSLGSNTPSDGTDPLSAAVDRLSAQTGALFVTAAGNTGRARSIGGPAAADAALTVGAVDSKDALAIFSSQGPRIGDSAVKPEITAPGVDVLAARSQYAGEGQGYYQTLSGTSMAAPHVTGAAVLIAAQHPELTGSQIKDLLVSSSLRTPAYDAFQAGSGRVDVAAAARVKVFATSTASTGTADPESPPVERPVTYTNLTDAAITLTLSVDAPGSAAGLFGLSANHVTVPAHGTAGVTVSIDGSAPTTDGHFAGQIVAADADGDALAHTAVSLGSTAHKLTMTFKDAQGRPMSGVVEVMRQGESDPDFLIVDDSGTGSEYLPAGIYSVLSFKDVQGVHGPHSRGEALLGDPEVSLDQDRTVTLDVGKIHQVDMTVPQPTATTYRRLEYFRSMDGASYRDYMETQTYYDSLWAQPTTHDVTHGDFYLGARWRKQQSALSVSTKSTDFTDVLRQRLVTPLPKGHYSLPVVFAGNGGASDYKNLNVRGKAVVVRRNETVADAAQAAAAAQAGVRLLLVENDVVGRQLRPYGSDFTTPAAVDVALLTMDQGEELVRQARTGKAVLAVASEPSPAYVYDLMQTWHNRIPADLVVRGGRDNLARVDVTFDASDPTVTGGEYRYDWPAYSNYGAGTTMQRAPVNGKRVDWVSTTGANTWGQEAFADGLLYEIEPRTTYRAGSTQTQEWFKPIQRPYLNDNYRLPSRSGNALTFDVPAYGSRDHVGMDMNSDLSQQTVTLYQGKTQLAQGTGAVVEADAPATGSLPYRLEVENSRDAAYSPYSSTTTTDWTFTSQAPVDAPSAVLPLLQLDYGLSTDAAGRADRNATLTAEAESLPGAVAAGSPGRVTLELSYDDGKTWHRASGGSDGRFRLDAPRKVSFVSLRASARDTAGNTVSQTVLRAAGLR